MPCLYTGLGQAMPPPGHCPCCSGGGVSPAMLYHRKGCWPVRGPLMLILLNKGDRCQFLPLVGLRKSKFATQHVHGMLGVFLSFCGHYLVSKHYTTPRLVNFMLIGGGGVKGSDCKCSAN